MRKIGYYILYVRNIDFSWKQFSKIFYIVGQEKALYKIDIFK